MNKGARMSTWLEALRTAWQQRSVRERRWLLACAALLTPIILWQWAMAPAWSVWREAPVRQTRIDAQTRQMLQLQAQAQSLQAAPARIDRRTALSVLQAEADRLLGPGAQLQPQGEHVLVTLRAAPATGLAQWLALARSQAQTLPLQVQLERPEASTTAHTVEVVWQGSLLMRLP